jgi:type IV pilus assembly protein PilM
MSSTPFWKREISLGRGRKDTDAGEQPTQAVQPHAEPVEADRSAAERIAAYAPEPAEGAALPPVTGDYGWLTQNFDPTEIPTAMPAIAPPAVSVPQRAPVAAPAAEAAPPPAVEVPAIRAVSDEPKQKEDADKKPFWKQELTLKRAPKAKKEKKEKQPKQPREPKAKQSKGQPAPDASAEEQQKPPFWKRELSIGKKAERAPKEPRAAKAAKTKVAKTKPAKANASKSPKADKKRADRGGAGKGNVVGLKIGASQIVAARVANGSEPQLLQVARVTLGDGVVSGGELRDIETLSAKLKELFSKNKLPKKSVRLGIANSRIGVRTFEISGIDDPQQLANAIRFRAQETLPIPLEEAVLDWQLLSERVDDETGQTVREVMLVVAYRELVDRYLAACRKAGIRVVGIDLEAFAMLRALGAPDSADAPAPTAAKVVVNVGHDRSTFAVSNGRVCEFTRVLSWGGQSVSVAIARALDLTPSEATPIKHAVSLVATTTEVPEGMTQEALDTARDAVLRELQSFARELVSSLRFYQNQPGSLGIGELVLTGGAAHLPGLSDELSRLIGVPVRVGDPLNRVVIPKKFRAPDCTPGSLTVAIGLGIED